MNRRTRTQRGAASGNLLARVMIGMIVLALVAAGLLYVSVRGYLHSEGFRQLLSEKVSKAVGVVGEFTPFRWHGLAVDTDAFDSTGEGTVRKFRLDGLHTEIGLGGLSRGAWEIRQARAQRVEVALDATAKTIGLPPLAEQVVETEAPRLAKKKSWLPRDVELGGLEVGELVVRADLDQGPLTASGIRIGVKPDAAKGSYRVELLGGTIHPPPDTLPELRLDHARLRYQNDTAFLTSATLEALSDARLNLVGEWDRKSSLFSLEGDISQLKCSEILDEDWAKRVTGEMNVDFSVGNHSGKPQARGKIAILQGSLRALPVLDVLAAYADSSRFRTLTLSQADAKWTWEKDLIVFDEIVLASEGLMRIEGRLEIRGEALDGNFRIGLVPGTLAAVPGVETHVFAPGERGMIWAPLRLTGTLDKPKEDFTERLILAAGMRILETLPETSEAVLNLTRTLIGEDSSKVLDRGAELIEKSGLNPSDVSGILNSLLGGGGLQPPSPKKDQ